MDYPCGKCGVFTFSHVGSIMHTYRQMRMNALLSRFSLTYYIIIHSLKLY